MIEIKLGELLNLTTPPKPKENSIFNRFYNLPLQKKYSHRVKRITGDIEKELKLYNESRLELFKKYGEETTNEKGEKGLTLKKENTEIFLKELNELLDVVVKLDFEPIPFEDLKDDLEISSLDLTFLEKFIVEKK